MKLNRNFRVYLKDIVIAGMLILIALAYYDKPKEIPKKVMNEQKLESTETEIVSSGDNELTENGNPLSIFKEEAAETKVEVKIPSFEEVLFGQAPGVIKLIAVTGTEKEKRALIIDHTNNVRVLKKGEKIDDSTVVISISDTSIKFKSKSRTKELSLYERGSIGDDTIKKIQPQPSMTTQRPEQEEIFEEHEHPIDPKLEHIKPPRRTTVR